MVNSFPKFGHLIPENMYSIFTYKTPLGAISLQNYFLKKKLILKQRILTGVISSGGTVGQQECRRCYSGHDEGHLQQ